LTEYVEGRWSTVWKPAQRTKVRGRLIQLCALTTVRGSDRSKLLAGLEAFRSDRGRRQTPSSVPEWAALWLRDFAFYPGKVATDANLLAGKRWLENNSMPLTGLNTKEVGRLRLHFTEGHDYATQRTYWSGTVVPFLRWLYETEKVPREVTLGQPALRRDLSGERPDPRRIPDPGELAKIAKEMGIAHGPDWELFVLVGGYCALRISETLAVRCDSFVRKDNRLWLVVNAQEHRVVAACSDDGVTKVRTGTKSTRDRTPPPRMVPIPGHLAIRLVDQFGDALGRDATHLFVGPRGGIANTETVRGWWHEAVATALPNHAKLVGIKPHVLRHAGMTYWFASGADHKRIQMWGGWTSLVQMLDTYRGVIESLEHINLEGLDRFSEQFTALDSTETAVSEAEGALEVPETLIGEPVATVTDLRTWRRRA
jgi:integrase